MARFNDTTEFTVAAILDYAQALDAIVVDLRTVARLADEAEMEAVFPTHFKSGAEGLEKIARFASEVRYAYGKQLANRHVKLKVAEDSAKYEAPNLKKASDAIQKTRKKRVGKEQSE